MELGVDQAILRRLAVPGDGDRRIAVDAEAETVVNVAAELGVGVTFDGGLFDAYCLVCWGLAASFDGAADGRQRVLEKG